MASSNSRRRFASTSDDEIFDKRRKLHAGNTLKANQKCGTIFREYFESYDSVRLNEALGHFYMDLRKPGGERYKTTSFESIRHGINRYLRAPPYNREFDIVKDACFSEANTNFRAVMAEMKRMGLAKIDHHPIINEADRHALYSSTHLSPDTPIGLANKVQFDIRLYFFRRGMENMHDMKKTDFQVQVDAKTGQKYVTKITDEMTKNHRETDKENFSGVMLESHGSQFCPVMSFERYIRRLLPLNERLWQKPRDSFAENSSWYCNAAVGEKTLSSFMKQLSKKCGLSQIYTNHSVRATGATILSKNMFGAAQIMAVTGHKSVQSLSTYQRVDTEEKIKMGQTITDNINPLSAQLALPSTEKLAITSTTPQTRQEDSSQVLQNLPTGSVQANTCNNTKTNSATYSRPQIFYGNVTIIQNLTINKS